jgi:hypothetical protein
MPRARTGTFELAKFADGRTVYRGRLRLADGTKSDRFDLPANMTERQARAYLTGLQADEDANGLVYRAQQERRRATGREPLEGETCSAYPKRLDAHRKELGRRNGRHDASAWRVWIADRIGHLPITTVSRDDVEAIRDMLDEAIAKHKRTAGKEGVSAKRAANIWSVVTTTFKARPCPSARTCACVRTIRAPTCCPLSAAMLVDGHSSIRTRRTLSWLVATSRSRGGRRTRSAATCT